MSVGTTVTPRITQLADRLVRDISTRKLSAGDRYLTAAEASKMLGVGNGSANKALQLLERRRLIVRQQRQGAVIVDPPESASGPSLDRIHFLVHQKYLRTEGVGQDDVLLGLEHELPGVRVQISFLPTAMEEAFVAELIDESLRAKRTEGFVLVRTPYEVQRLVTDRNVPAVVYGTLYPSIDRIATLSMDMTAVGGILANHLLECGHTRFAYLNRQFAYGGDQQTIEGIQAALHEAGVGLDALALRFMPSVTEAYLAEAEHLLSCSRPPQAFICRSFPMAYAVCKVAERMGHVVGGDIGVAICEYYLQKNDKQATNLVWAETEINSEAKGRHLARLLVSQVKNNNKDPAGHEVMPVWLSTPNKRGCRS